MEKCGRITLIVMVVVMVPLISPAQDVAEKIYSLHSVLDTLRTEMKPLYSKLTGVGCGIAGFAALWYICSRIWKHMMNAEPIDFYPLFRPFVLGFCILNFPMVIAMIDGIMNPVVTATSGMVKGSDQAVKVLLEQKKMAIKDSPVWQMYVGETGDGNRDAWYKYTNDGEDPEKEKWYEVIGNRVQFAMAKASYKFRNSIKEWMSEVLKVLFQAASLCINTLRTFQLIVLSIIGPIVFGIAVFDGFQHTLSAWLSKYINVYLWLPVANIFGSIIGKIQEGMLKLDLKQIKDAGDTFFSATDTGYLIFLIIGIVGYFTVPSVASFVVNAGGGGAMMSKVTSMASSAPGMAMGAAGKVGGAMDTISDLRKNYKEGRSGQDGGSGAAGAIGRAAGRALGAGLNLGNRLRGGSEPDKK